MTLTPEDRTILIKHYQDKSLAAIDNVRLLLEHNRFSLAVNQIYYGVYYMLSAHAKRGTRGFLVLPTF